MTKKNVSWPLFTVLGALGLGAALLAPGCTVTSGDDDIDVDAGAGGSTGGTGSKSAGGSAGSSSSGGSSSGGSSSGGTSSGGTSNGGSGGEATGGTGGTGAQMLACEGTTVIPWPNCEADDTDDECTACLKMNCCDTWRDCVATDETAGDFVCGWGGPQGNGEFGCIAQCMRDGAADVGDCTGDCMASSAAWGDPAPCSDGTITQATNDLIGCMTDGATTCEAECFE